MRELSDVIFVSQLGIRPEHCTDRKCAYKARRSVGYFATSLSNCRHIRNYRSHAPILLVTFSENSLMIRYCLKRAFYAKSKNGIIKKPMKLKMNSKITEEAVIKKGGPYYLCNVTLVTLFGAIVNYRTTISSLHQIPTSIPFCCLLISVVLM